MNQRYRHNIRRIIIRIIIISAFLWVGYKIFTASQINRAALENRLESTFTPNWNDTVVIKHEIFEQLGIKEVVRSKVRNPISVYTFKDSFKLAIHEIDLQDQIILNEALSITKEMSYPSTQVSYGAIDINSFVNFKFADRPAQKVSGIIINVSGQHVRGIRRSENSVLFGLLCSSWSIKYSKDGPIDLLVAPYDNLNSPTRIPIEIGLIKSRNSLYVALLCPQSNKAPPPNYLNEILKIEL